MPDNVYPEPERTTRPTRLRQLYQSDQSDTRPSPRDPETWLSRAEMANTQEESLRYLNRALAIDPHHRPAARKMDEMLQQILHRDPFLGYIQEDDSSYRVQTGADLMLQVPKNRAVPEPFPLKTPSPLQPAFRWLGVALLGLPLAGLGTLISIPMILLYVVRAYRQPLSQADQIRASLLLTVAIVLISLALILALLLLLHT